MSNSNEGGVQKQHTYKVKLQSKPDQVSFTGFSCPKPLENLKVIETLENMKEIESYPLRQIFDAAKKFVAKDEKINNADVKAVHKTTKDLIEKAIDAVQNPEQKAEETVQKFLEEESNGKNIKTFLDDIKGVIKHSDSKIDHNAKEYKTAVKGFVGEAVDVLHSVENPGKIFKSKGLKKVFEGAEKNQVMFSAMVSALLACILRPITIVSLPGKKNKEDKKYAAAHSISSGVMGAVSAFIISTPIASAIKKLADKPEKFLDKESIDFLANKKPEGAVKVGRRIAEEAFEFGGAKRFGIARKYLNMGPDSILEMPKAILTIAAIPFVLKYVFGMEKKSSKSHAPAAQAPAVAAAPVKVFKSSNEPVRKVFQNFMGESK